MRFLLLALFAFCAATFRSTAAPDTASTVRWAFPITDYMVPLGDTVMIVQVMLPANIRFVSGRQLGLLRGVAQGNNAVDTGVKGWGKCHLIKAQYNYFPLHLKEGTKPRGGDLLYTLIPKRSVGNISPVFYAASHGITFTSVEDSAFYRPADFLKPARTKVQDEKLEAAMVADIRATGKMMLEQDTTMNRPVTEGAFRGRRLLEAMTEANKSDLELFLAYVAARPIRYAGNRWKISETYATWMLGGAPGKEAR